jgi:hypothetical protein
MDTQTDTLRRLQGISLTLHKEESVEELQSLLNSGALDKYADHNIGSPVII